MSTPYKRKRNRQTLEQFITGIQRRKQWLDDHGIDLNAPPKAHTKSNYKLPAVKVDVEEELTVLQ